MYGTPEKGQTRMDNAPVTAETVTEVDQPGVIFDRNMQNQCHSERNIAPSCFRIMHALACSSVLLYQLMSHEPDCNVVTQAWESVTADWTCLRTLLSCGDDELASLFHLIIADLPWFASLWGARPLNTAEMRSRWEADFVARIVQARTSSLHGSVTEAAKRFFSEEACSLELSIVEQGCSGERFPAIMRCVAPPLTQTLAAYFCSAAEFATKHPFLNMYMQNLEKLSPLSNLMPIVQWTKWFLPKFSKQISRQVARSKTFHDILCDHPEMRDDYNDFEEAWNTMRPYITRWNCTDFEMPELTAKASTSYCCIEERDHGLFLHATIQHPVALQNSFLNEVVVLAAQGVEAAKCLRHSPHMSGIQSTHLSDLVPKFVVNLPCPDVLLKWRHPKLRYGQGREHVYDLEQIKLELQFDMITGKRLLDTQRFRPFVFQFEIFHGSVYLFQELNGKIPQEELERENKNAIDADEVIRTHA